MGLEQQIIVTKNDSRKTRTPTRARLLAAFASLALAALILTGCSVTSAAPSKGSKAESTCPAGLLDAVKTRLQKGLFPGVVPTYGTVADIQPPSLRPLMKDACITKYTSPNTGNKYTFSFSAKRTQQEIGDAVRSSGFQGDTGFTLSQYILTVAGKDPATVTVFPTEKIAAFSKFYPKGLSIQTAEPPSGASSQATAAGVNAGAAWTVSDLESKVSVDEAKQCTSLGVNSLIFKDLSQPTQQTYQGSGYLAGCDYRQPDANEILIEIDTAANQGTAGTVGSCLAVDANAGITPIGSWNCYSTTSPGVPPVYWLETGNSTAYVGVRYVTSGFSKTDPTPEAAWGMLRGIANKLLSTSSAFLAANTGG
jgi:hypothetical protein